MGLKMVTLLVLAMSALMIVASATTTSPDDDVGPDGIIECLVALPGLRVCGRSVSDLFKRGKVSITRKCCEAIGSAVRDCLDIVLKEYGITADQLNLLLGLCELVPVPAPVAPTVAPTVAPAIAPTTAPAPL